MKVPGGSADSAHSEEPLEMCNKPCAAYLLNDTRVAPGALSADGHETSQIISKESIFSQRCGFLCEILLYSHTLLQKSKVIHGTHIWPLLMLYIERDMNCVYSKLYIITRTANYGSFYQYNGRNGLLNKVVYNKN